MRFRLVPKSSTLDDLELLKFKFSRNFALVGMFRRQQRQTNEDPHCRRGIVEH